MDNQQHENYIDFNNIMLPIGIARAKGPIENFEITIYDKSGRPYRYKVIEGNITQCNTMGDHGEFDYGVK